MIEYIPFVKFKVNEVAAIKALKEEERRSLIPFIDIPRRKNINGLQLANMIDKCSRKFELNLTDLPEFYIDNYDIDESVLIDNDDNYQYIINKFSPYNFIPVVGLDRSKRRNETVVKSKKGGAIASDIIALRLTHDDFQHFQLVENELEELMLFAGEHFNLWHLILDNRVCHGIEPTARATQIIQFLEQIQKIYKFDKIIISGSCITASIGEILSTENSLSINRVEISIFRDIIESLSDTNNIVFGDYTIVSPNFSEFTLDPRLFRKVTAPKLIYAYKDLQFIIRGGNLEGHPRGNHQYNDLSETLVSKKYFRGEKYSFGDRYLAESSSNPSKISAPNSIIKPLINAHITFMLNDFKL